MEFLFFFIFLFKSVSNYLSIICLVYLYLSIIYIYLSIKQKEAVSETVEEAEVVYEDAESLSYEVGDLGNPNGPSRKGCLFLV